MAENGTATFDNPDDYQAGIGGASVNLIVTGGGDFNARLTWLNLRRIHVLRASENLPRIAFFSLSPAQVFVSFPTSEGLPLTCGGLGLQFGDVVFHSRGERTHQRTNTESQWGLISLPPEHLADVMVRFEDALTTHRGPQLNMPALCAAIDVPERTLRVCCTEFLGMSPTRYLLLRRLNMARSALRRADPATASVAEIARIYQFREPGRFAVTYRTIFGEMPSSTLRRKSIKNINLPKSHSVRNATCGRSPGR